MLKAGFEEPDNRLQCEACGKLVEAAELKGWGFTSLRCELCVLAGNEPQPEYKNPVYGEDSDA